MNTLILLIRIIGGIALHALALWLLIRHLRSERHRAHIPVIGSSPQLTKVLHLQPARSTAANRLAQPHTMRAKVNAWLRKGACE